MAQKPAWSRAEAFVCAFYDLERTPNEPGEGWYDCINPRTGAKYQVKSAQRDRRFRLWSDQHRSLVASDANGVAWYVFVTSGEDPRRVKPSTVTKWVNERGGWNKANHELRPGALQHKLPVSEVFG